MWYKAGSRNFQSGNFDVNDGPCVGSDFSKELKIDHKTF